MSEENVELVRRLGDSFRARDAKTPFEILDPAVVWDTTRSDFPGLSEVFHGHEGVRTFWRRWLDAWDQIDFDASGWFDADDMVVVFYEQRNHGRLSGIWADLRWAGLWEFADGRVVRLTMYTDFAEALRVAGLNPKLADG